MSKKGKGLFALITGMAAGAAAVFLSEEKNRAKTVKAVKKAETSARRVVRKAQRRVTTKKTSKK